jgi:hypothetical protein
MPRRTPPFVPQASASGLALRHASEPRGRRVGRSHSSSGRLGPGARNQRQAGARHLGRGRRQPPRVAHACFLRMRSSACRRSLDPGGSRLRPQGGAPAGADAAAESRRRPGAPNPSRLALSGCSDRGARLRIRVNASGRTSRRFTAGSSQVAGCRAPRTGSAFIVVPRQTSPPQSRNWRRAGSRPGARRPCFPRDASVARHGTASGIGRERQPDQECRCGRVGPAPLSAGPP